MQVVETFGRTVEAWSNQNPQRARTLLRTGWEAQNLKNRFSPDKRLQPADRKLARIMMDAMLAPLQDPEHSAMVSVFTPCEMLQEPAYVLISSICLPPPASNHSDLEETVRLLAGSSSDKSVQPVNAAARTDRKIAVIYLFIYYTILDCQFPAGVCPEGMTHKVFCPSSK